MSGGDPTAAHAAQHVAPLRLRAVSLITQSAAGSRFWQRVNSGAERLNPEEDALVWSLRGAGLTFDEIADAVVARRKAQWLAIASARRSAAATRMNRERWARKWREDYRRERGL